MDCNIKYKKVDDFIDYAKVVSMIKEDIKYKKYLLIEDALDEIIKMLKSSFPSIKKIDLTISKPDILEDCVVSISKSY